MQIKCYEVLKLKIQICLLRLNSFEMERLNMTVNTAYLVERLQKPVQLCAFFSKILFLLFHYPHNFLNFIHQIIHSAFFVLEIINWMITNDFDLDNFPTNHCSYRKKHVFQSTSIKKVII
jgi:hypothetical protein